MAIYMIPVALNRHIIDSTPLRAVMIGPHQGGWTC